MDDAKEKNNVITNPGDLVIGNTYFSLKKNKQYTFMRKGRARNGVCIFYLLKEGKPVALPWYGEGVKWLELSPINEVEEK